MWKNTVDSNAKFRASQTCIQEQQINGFSTQSWNFTHAASMPGTSSTSTAMTQMSHMIYWNLKVFSQIQRSLF
jgi:hypothetical protein